jgi:hypothetical protein
MQEYNKKYSLEEFAKLRPAQRTAFRNDLKKLMDSLRKSNAVKVLDDDYLFSVAAAHANFSMMQLVNEYRDLMARLKNTRGDQKQVNDLSRMLMQQRKKVLEALFGDYALFNQVDPKTIAVNPEILKVLMG